LEPQCYERNRILQIVAIIYCFLQVQHTIDNITCYFRSIVNNAWKTCCPDKLLKKRKETKMLFPHLSCLLTHIITPLWPTFVPHQYLSIIICTCYYSSMQTQSTSISHNEFKLTLWQNKIKSLIHFIFLLWQEFRSQNCQNCFNYSILV
jgi:hypothetical protein